MRYCFITGTTTQHGHNVSHANNKTKRLFKVNLHSKRIFSESMGWVKVCISHRGERTIDKYGGLDQFLLTAKNRKLTAKAKVVRRKLNKINKKIDKN